MGLPGSGKTELAKVLIEQLQFIDKSVAWFNADAIRETYNDWDFTHEGRLRQARRMKTLASIAESDFTVCDFVAPLPEMRTLFDADYTIWMDTIQQGRFEDTNKLFHPPEKYNLRLTDFNYSIKDICENLIHINNIIN
jgi:adenylylsulfate kinase